MGNFPKNNSFLTYRRIQDTARIFLLAVSLCVKRAKSPYYKLWYGENCFGFLVSECCKNINVTQSAVH